jgi:hypothetical protein
MWYNNDDYKPVSPHRKGGGARRRHMIKLFSIEEIRSMMGSTEPIEGCMIVKTDAGWKRKQIAFTNEQPDDAQWLWFEYQTDPHSRYCIPIFHQPTYGVILGDVEGSVYDTIPIAKLTGARRINWGVACFRRDGEERRLFLNVDLDGVYYILMKRNPVMKLGDCIIVHFPYDQQRVERAKALGGKFFAELKAWVFPADLQKEAEALLG